MKILILGAQGNLGGQLTKTFQNDYDIIAWDKGEIDITDQDLIIKKIGDIKPNIIINAAAYNAVDKCEESEEEYNLAKKINGLAPGYLAQAAMNVNAVLIHYSTDYVFGGHTPHHAKTLKEIKAQGGFMEDDAPRPINKYGHTKLTGEEEIKKLSGRGLKWYLIRTSKLFGPRGENEFSKSSFFDVILNLSKNKNEINVVNDEKSCFTYTPDLARATKSLVEEKYGYGIYHIVNEGACTWYEATQELFKIAGVEIKVNPVTADQFPRPAKRPKYSVLLNTKFPKLRDWRGALREYI
jgi:dTDP-4-dehydrorhamnose reductase